MVGAPRARAAARTATTLSCRIHRTPTGEPSMPAVRPSFCRAVAAVGLVVAAGGASAQSATEAELARRLDALAAELAAVKAQLATLQRERAAANAGAAAAGA